ncbi:MAG: inositol monophosphatase family protein [Campylobacterota bacterium]|nr:inositol monophosphatase family protein [Campylobacterota bacterium]
MATSLQQSDRKLLSKEHEIGHGGDISIEADLLCERILLKYLSKYGQILSEESGYIGEGEQTVVIDPLDGSSNFKSQFPYYGTSIALRNKGETLCGVVCNFENGDFFFRSNTELFVKNIFDHDRNAYVQNNANSAVGLFEKSYDYPEVVASLKKKKLKFRSPGAVALSLAYAHYVEYVLFLGTMRDYDILAGMHLCKDLNHYQDENCIIISKDKTSFETLCDIIIKKDNI